MSSISSGKDVEGPMMAWPIGGRRFWGGGGLQPRVLLQYALLTALGFFAMTMLFKDRSSLDLPNVSPSREDATPIGAELFNPPETKEAQQFYSPKHSKYSIQLAEKLQRIQKCCGEICDTRPERFQSLRTRQKNYQGKKYFDYLEKEVSCPRLFECHRDIDQSATSRKPPKDIPGFLRQYYSYQGRVPIIPYYLNDANGVHHDLKWTKASIAKKRQQFRDGKLEGNYGKVSCDNIYKHLVEHVQVQNKSVLVIGSQNPWLEAIILEAGAAHITTLEYVAIENDHPQITTILPEDLSLKFLAGTQELFDVMVTFSSLEHSGLGRYGDDLNPWGDLITMARAWCLMKPGGRALVGLPTGPDRLEFNAHRVYGPIQLPHFFANWEQVYTEANLTNQKGCSYCYQPPIVVRKPDNIL